MAPGIGGESLDPKTVFVISIATMRMIMPGMPSMPKIPGMKDFTAPNKTLTMSLTSDKKASAQSKAECAVPGGLKVGPKVILAIDQPSKSEEGVSTSSDGEKVKPTEFKIKTYWGCSETVLEGQPKVLDSKNMSAEMERAMKKGSYKNFKRAIDAAEDGSHAYWPSNDGKEIVAESTSPGDYELTTSYCGGTSFSLSSAQDFLAPMDVVSPKGEVDLTKAIKLEWKTVPNAQAYLLSAFSGKEKEMTLWTSSTDPEVGMDIQNKPLSADEVKKLIKNGVLLPPDATHCYIPAGIFKGENQPMLSLIAVGADKQQVKDGINTQVIIRSTAMMLLGKGMGMGAMDAGDDQEPDNDGAKPESSVKPVKTPAADDSANQGEVKDSGNKDSGDAVDQANDGMDKVEGSKDKVKDTVNKAKRILKW